MAVQGVADVLIPVFRTGALTVAAGTARIPVPFAARVLGMSVAVNTAPTGATLNVALRQNGNLVTGATASVAISAFAATASFAAPFVLAPGDYVTVDVTQIGSGVAGSDLGVTLWLEKV